MTTYLAFDLNTRKIGTVDLPAGVVLTDLRTDTMYVASQGTLYAAFSGYERRTSTYKTGLITMPSHTAMAWAVVFGEQTPGSPVIVRWYGDGELRHTATFGDTKPQRLPPGRWLEHEVEVESQVRVTSVILAGSLAELQSA